MPLSHVTKEFATQDAKISKLLTDPAGGPATYASLVDVPGIKSVSIGGSVETKNLRGDNTLLDSDTVLTDITVTFNYAKLSLDALAVMLGGAVADTGTTPNMKATFALLGTDNLFNQFKFEAVVPKVDTPTGDLHLVLYKCRLSTFPEAGTEEDDYKTFSVSAVAVPRIADAKWIDIVLNETAAAIA